MPRAGEMQRGEKSVEIVEKDKDINGILVLSSDKKYLWGGTDIAEERTPDGGTITKRFYNQGFVDNDGTTLFYNRDHLGSIRELTDGTQAVRARYDYDPYGRMTKISGDRDSVFGFTGHFWHGQSSLILTMYRAYDPGLGRWLSRDPIGEEDTINIYLYVGNSPIDSRDAFGLETQVCCRPLSGGHGAAGLFSTHCFFRFSDGHTLGLFPDDPTAVWSVGTPKVDQDDDKNYRGKACKSCKPKSDCLNPENCIKNGAGGSRVYNLLFDNSNTFAHNLAKKCCGNSSTMPPDLGWPVWPQGW